MSDGGRDWSTMVLQPRLLPGDYVFCHLPQGNIADAAALSPLATFMETEGLSVVLPSERAESAGLAYEGLFRVISLDVYSGLEEVGLTARVATQLAAARIPANVVAAFHHDHILVPAELAERALALLTQAGD